jgi:hypothetical protein
MRLLVIEKLYRRISAYAVGTVLIEPKGQMFLVNIVVGGTGMKGRLAYDFGVESHFLNKIKQIILGAGKAVYAGSGEAGDHALDSTPGKCTVCHKSLSEGDLIVECPSCGGKSHKTHMLEWLHTRDYCPSCRVRLTESSLVPVQR